MNEKFYTLPAEKQKRIIDAGFYVFSQNSYKKSSMNEIAQQADISKSLLFFYFRNKRELYLFLWNTACDLTVKYLTAYHCYEPADLFLMMERGMEAKLAMMEKYPYMANFAVRAFFEKDAEVASEIQSSYRAAFSQKATKALAQELGPSGIRVNCVAPGVIATEMNAALSPETMEALKEETPLGVIGTPEDAAESILFLASDRAAFITGQVLSPNGGMVL